VKFIIPKATKAWLYILQIHNTQIHNEVQRKTYSNVTKVLEQQ